MACLFDSAAMPVLQNFDTGFERKAASKTPSALIPARFT
jgi:hypothetical protein